MSPYAWTTIAFPAPPFLYKGGFYCPTDAARRVDASRCDGFDAKVAGSAYVVTMKRSTIRALDQGLALENVRGYADAYNSDGVLIRFDETATGLPYTFTTGNSSKLRPPAPVVPTHADGRSPSESAPAVEQSARGSAAGLPTLALFLAAGFAAFWARRP